LRAASGDAGAPLEDLTLQEVERALIEKALARNAGNVAGAARLLGLSRSAMYRRMERYGL
jgi:transcriptional regulator of acetoin/glycerol metabolism